MGAKIVDKEPNSVNRQIKEVIWIRKSKTPIKVSYPQMYDDVIHDSTLVLKKSKCPTKVSTSKIYILVWI